MGIQVEYNPDLALRNYAEYEKGKRAIDECVPKKLVKNTTHHFLKKGQRNYWLHGEIPLLETKGEGVLSKPIASIIIIEATHFVKDKEIYTRGTYQIMEVFTNKKIHFNGFNKI